MVIIIVVMIRKPRNAITHSTASRAEPHEWRLWRGITGEETPKTRHCKRVRATVSAVVLQFIDP